MYCTRVPLYVSLKKLSTKTHRSLPRRHSPPLAPTPTVLCAPPMSITEEEPTTLAVDTTYLSPSNFLSDMDFVPQELQLPLVIIIGLLGFLAVLGLSKLSSKADDESSSSKKTLLKTTTTSAPATPVKTRSSEGDTPLNQKTGTVMTPAGRRSARIARTRRKEE